MSLVKQAREALPHKFWGDNTLAHCLAWLHPREIVYFESTSKSVKQSIGAEAWRTLLVEYPWALSDGRSVANKFEAENKEELVKSKSLWRQLWRLTTQRNNSAIIVDLGSYTVKAGYSCDSAPSLVEPTATFCRRPYDSSWAVEEFAEILKNILEGGMCVRLGTAKVLVVMRPIDVGHYNPVVPMEKFVRKIGKACFSILGLAAVRMEFSPVCALISKGLSSGVVLESGRAMTYACSVYKGKLVRHRFQETMISKYGGEHLTALMQRFASEAFGSGSGVVNVNDAVLMKESLTYVRAAKSNWKPTKEIDFLLDSVPFRLTGVTSGGKEGVVQLREERFMVPEALFAPKMFETHGIIDSRYSKDMTSIEELCRRALDSVTDDRGYEIRQNLVCIGGGLDFPDLEARLQRSLKRNRVRVSKVVGGSRRLQATSSYENRRWLAWKGAATLVAGRGCEFCISLNDGTLCEMCLEMSGQAFECKVAGGGALQGNGISSNGELTASEGMGKWATRQDWMKMGSAAFYKRRF